MNPFLYNENDSTTATAVTELPLLTEYGWDFKHDKFLNTESGQHVIVEKNEALKVWIYKTLKTERFRYVAYHESYGIELEKYIGQTNIPNVANAIKKDIKEALSVNPYIKSIDKIEVTKQSGDIVELTIHLTSIYSNFSIKVVI